ncbi:MAG: pyridine nucleotide-disulfide oxidoreductase [Candidatus Colwellbacteria bacterium CG23_combo_of_CG06-09_8_20_14_all_42_19]|uniref:Pyridine nucleotide-disulfide oxidoreductase n=1 Tax=Candidatus Colwellbacteria bacterium CG23_combo_of_CG06-09_8_20_14_all_42_19 TaxID=1974541 RepID=A0A2H0AKV1_9BACT|nr:MAG: pyridine nucleotide-disulfide oxidoreductase [Candidatus Colwellbacteria bacterium CG23_combo_of_CG06-09_8_20_14_all_42_19]
MYDLVIVGGGPGGVAAGVYAARKKIKTLIIAETFGGQSLVSADIKNWIGTKSISGFELAKALEEHLRAQEDIEIIDGVLVNKVVKEGSAFKVVTSDGKEFQTKNVLISSGSRRRKLDIPGETKFDGRGVAYCSTCDAPIFKNKRVAVVGGGNAGLEAVLDLIPYATEIYLIQRSDILKGDSTTQEKIKSDPKVKIITMAKPLEIEGDKFVENLKYEDRNTGEIKEIRLEGVFVEVGSIPNADMVKDLVELNKYGEIVVDHKTQRTSCEGIWAAGDVSDVIYKQNNISAGDAVKAVLDIYGNLNKN